MFYSINFPDFFFPFPALIRQKTKKSGDRGLQVACFEIFKVSLHALDFPWSVAECPLTEQSQLNKLSEGFSDSCFAFLDLTQFQTASTSELSP